MKSVLWLIIRKAETIKVKFKVNWIEWFFLKRIMSKKKVKIVKNNQKLTGESYEGVIVDEWGNLK